MSKQTLGLGAALAAFVCAIVCAIVWRSLSGGGPATTPPPATAAPRAGAAGPDDVSACRFARGETHRFAYTSTTHSEVRPVLPGVRPEDTPPQLASTELTGALSLEVLEVTAADAVLLARLSGLNAQARQLLGDAVEAPFLVAVNARCEVTRVARHRDTPRPVARAHGVVANELSFFVPTGDAPEERRFSTALGVQRALVLVGNEPGQTLRKALAYESRWNPRLTEIDVTEGEVQARRGSSRWFESLRGVEVVAGGAVRFSKNEWSLQRQPPEADALAKASRMLTDYVWENPFAADAREDQVTPQGDSQDQKRRVEAMREVSYPVALERFTLLLGGGANINDQWRDMAAFLDAHPDQVPAFVEHITAPDFPAGHKAPAFLALGQARTPAARDALLGLYRERGQQPADRMRSSLALALRADVGAPLAKELKAEALRPPQSAEESGVSRQAVLHLGVLAFAHPGEQEITEEATSLVQQLASTARTPEDWSVVFGLVGNLAEGTLLSQVEQWTHLQDPEIRQHVPRALRRYRVDRAQPIFVEWLGRETNPAVKRELFNVIHHMYVDANRPVGDALMGEALRHLREQPQVLTRQSLFHILAPYVATNAAVREAFKHQLVVELEERSGLYSLVAEYLPAASIYEALSTVPGLRAQFGGSLKPELPSAPVPEEVPIGEFPLPDADQDPQANLGSAP